MTKYVPVFEEVSCSQCDRGISRLMDAEEPGRGWVRSEDFQWFICPNCWKDLGGDDGQEIRLKIESVRKETGLDLSYHYIVSDLLHVVQVERRPMLQSFDFRQADGHILIATPSPQYVKTAIASFAIGFVVGQEEITARFDLK